MDVAGAPAPRLAVRPAGLVRALATRQHRRGGPDAQPLPVRTVGTLVRVYGGHQQEDGSGRFLYSIAVILGVSSESETTLVCIRLLR